VEHLYCAQITLGCIRLVRKSYKVDERSSLFRPTQRKISLIRLPLGQSVLFTTTFLIGRGEITYTLIALLPCLALPCLAAKLGKRKYFYNSSLQTRSVFPSFCLFDFMSVCQHCLSLRLHLFV